MEKLFFLAALLVSIKSDFNDADNYEKYGHPSQPNVVERYGALERVPTQLGAIRVVLIPIDAWRLRRWIQTTRHSGACENILPKNVVKCRFRMIC